MGQGRLCHSFWLYSVLIAVAIQAVTPDAHDLASMNALLLFCPTLAGSRDLADDDGLPDEVCGPAQSEMGVASRGKAEASELASTLWVSTDLKDPLASQPGALRSHARSGNHPRLYELIYSLCRLRC
jgi:hypothetical protein